jgi:hypothetical protein
MNEGFFLGRLDIGTRVYIIALLILFTPRDF